MICPGCGFVTMHILLGCLGRRMHLRCEDCGWTWSLLTPED